MTSQINLAFFRRSFAGAILLCLLVTGYGLLRYPGILLPIRVGLLFLGVFLAVLAIDFILIWWLTGDALAEAGPIAGRGVKWGILIAGFWLIEIVAGNLLDPQQRWVQLLYYGSTLIALLLPMAAGFVAVLSLGHLRAGILTALWSGLVSGVLTFLALMIITYLFLNHMLHDPQNLAQFQESSAPDLVSFVVGESLAGGIGHLVIGLVLAPALGSIGSLIGLIFVR